jgi:hypothetical protein
MLIKCFIDKEDNVDKEDDQGLRLERSNGACTGD